MSSHRNLSKNSIEEGEVFLIDKPLNYTSFQVVKKLRNILKNKFNLNKLKVGHAGTLDPLATGLLIICTGRMTKQIPDFQNLYKEYVGTMSIGSTTPSYDLETKIDKTFSTDHINENLLNKIKDNFIGTIDQVPPIFSAVKKNGKRLYEYAREGKKIDIKSKKVTINKFDLKHIYIPKIDFEVNCSKGTYIRSLINDFGRDLNSGAHLVSLRRTKIGSFSINNSITIDEFIKNLK
ncbi:MAG: tRNA pseudouridine(55) synthase TruB [Flavobacteriaceae bacterium]|nr:tRNA pseudouridine(55) synthase TruB [Flavobacteriaceae bacterium]MBJ25995.1 tRNA pseudouridine(55) synthase TruB [Flavobacteriaceae bacterium]|tara:strand:+ start:11147 stop:11851 length:705 start_codon:yes stop_codon:yes gene_type:complete